MSRVLRCAGPRRGFSSSPLPSPHLFLPPLLSTSLPLSLSCFSHLPFPLPSFLPYSLLSPSLPLPVSPSLLSSLPLSPGVRRSGSDSQLTQHVSWKNKKTHFSMDSDTSSSHHHISSPHTLPTHTTTILHSEVLAQPSQPGQAGQTGQTGWQQPHPSLHPTDSVSLASMSRDEKREMLRGLVSDPDMREELPSLLEPALLASTNPLLSLQGDLHPPPASPPKGGALTSQARGPGMLAKRFFGMFSGLVAMAMDLPSPS